MEAAGALGYLFLGVCGLLVSGHFLYNVGVDPAGIAGDFLPSLFDYPDGVGAGIIPYLNLAVMLKVSAGLTTVMIVLLEGRR
jgi:energy-converting hydrogenase B subunit I